MRDRRFLYSNPGRQSTRGRRRGGFSGLVPMVLVAGLAGAVGGLMLERTGVGDWLMAPAAPRVTVEHAPRHFALCSGASRNTCVVDGDTFWLDGIKIRIADINTPETGAPQCAAEAALGRRATERLRELLNEGTFSLVGIDRDEDQYGRKLRIVERNGRSVGAVLVAEGLAHEWRGRRESWC